MQTEIAQILGMERGTDKRVSGTERIEPRKYAQMKNKERKERLKDAELIDRLIRSISEFGTNNKILNQKIKAKNQKIDELQERPTRQELEAKEKELKTLESKLQDKDKTINELQERPTTEQYSQLERTNSEQAQTIQEKDREIATAIDIANQPFSFTKETLQEAVERSNIVIEQYFLLKNIHNNPTDEKVEKQAEKHKHYEVFTKLWNAIKLLYNIIEKLFGDENAKKDHQDILNTISELQERPTKQELQAKDKELNTLKQERTDLTNKIQKQEKTINELNKFKNSSNLALDLEKAQERIETLESNETALVKAVYDKESIIQSKGRTINRLKKELKELECNYHQNRERMQAENKCLKDQGLEKIYTQKDYEDLKKAHHQEVEELKKQIQEYKTQETYTPTKRM